MANQLALEVTAGSSSPRNRNQSNESSSSGSPCEGDHPAGEITPSNVLSNDTAETVVQDNLRLVAPNTDGDGNGQSSFVANALDSLADYTAMNLPDTRPAGGGPIPPHRFSQDNRGNVADKSKANTVKNNTSDGTGNRQAGANTPTDASMHRATNEMDVDGSVASRTPSTGRANHCHEVVKTSAIAGERRGNLCSVHQSGVRKAKINVACQTDPDEETFPKIMQSARTSIAQPVANKGTVASSSTDGSSPTSSTSSDGTLRLMIQNFTNMSDTVRGPSKKIQTVPWRIMVMPRQHVVQKKGTQKCLGFFLQCCPDAYSDSWSCQAAAELRLISQKQGVPHFTRKTNHVYTAKENDWGYSCFMTWADILDESQGYIKDDKVILEVSVKAEPPKNILTHEQFEKKIQDYMRLADIQSSRGLIDKAIEVNMSALKFCKDRDQDCKADLEAQKAKLIEMKLKQSIERIEKGPPLGKGDEENSLNQSALKQAISGNATVNKQMSMGKSSSKANATTKGRETNVEKSGSVQNRTETSPLNNKPSEVRPVVESDVTDARPLLEGDKNEQEIPTELLLNAANELKWLSEGEKQEGVEDTRQEKIPVQVDVATFNNDQKQQTIEDKKPVAERLEEKPEGKTELLGADYQKNDVLSLGPKLVEDNNDMLRLSPRMRSLNEQCQQIMRKQRELEKNKHDGQEPVEPVLRCTYDVSGHAQPWELCRESKEQRMVGCSSDEETSLSTASSDSETDEHVARTHVGVPFSKKMKRSLRSNGGGGATAVRDDCDSCIQAILEPASHTTEEVSCQTELSVLMPKTDAAVVNAHTGVSNGAQNRSYAQPKKQTAKKTIPAADWRRKKMSEIRDLESRKKHEEQPRFPRGDSPIELTKESLARFTSQFVSSDSKPFPSVPMYHPPPQQIVGDDMANPQLQSYMDDSAQQNIWSRQYIEEWLKFNIKYCWKYMKNGENPPPGTDEGTYDFSGNIPHFTDAQVQQVMAALSVIGVNCVNAKRVVDKAAEFINTLEMRSKSPFLKSCLQKLAILAGDEKVIDALKDGRRDVDCAALDEHHLTAPLVEDVVDDFTSLMSECPDDQHDYMLNREVHRIGVFADQAVSKNPLLEIGQAEKLHEHTEKIAQRIALLENDKDTLSRQIAAEKEKCKKQEQKHANAIKQMQGQLQSEKDKHEKTMQQLNQKKNELKKLEKVARQHDRDTERARELQEKNEHLTRELQEMRQKHAEELRKLQRELQSSQDTRKNMTEEIKGRDTEISELKNQLNERSLALKRSENALSSERKTFQNNQGALMERAKKAEISLLEHKLETGVAVLERALKDAGQRVKDLEVELKKARSAAVVEEYKGAIADWKAKREEVAGLITTAKAEFAAQIEQIKAGKTMAQLPKISVPKPPPAPKFKIGQFNAHVPPVAPEKTGALPSLPVVGVIGNRTHSTGLMMSSSLTSSNVSSGSAMQTMSKAPAPPSTSPMKSPTGNTASITPIGVRPISRTGAVDYATSHTATVSSANSMQPSTSTSAGLSMPTNWSSSWDGPLAMNSISELLNPSRSFGPIGTDYGIGNVSSSNQLSHPPPGHPNSSTHFTSQSNGWSNGPGNEWLNSLSSGSNTNAMMSNQQSHFGHMQHHQGSGFQSQQWSNWSNYHTPTSGTTDVTNALMGNSRSSSPRRDVLLDALRNHFPHISPESLKEYANEFMIRNNVTNLKSLSMGDLINYVAMVSNKIWNKSSNMPAMMHHPPPNVLSNSVGVNMSGVDPYQSSGTRVHSQQQCIHSHTLMQQQMRDGMES